MSRCRWTSAEGAEVSGGCVAVDGRLVVRATRVGADTRLAQMAALVEEAQTRKAAAQRLADRVSGLFVPVVLTLAAATWGFWLGAGAGAAMAVDAATAVLIVACPCALGLATPTALLVGTGRGAQLGILITGPEVLESTRRIDTILLDKTGTLTRGEMSVTDVVLADGEDLDDGAGGGRRRWRSPPSTRWPRPSPGTPPTGSAAVPAARKAVALDGLGMRGVVDGRKVLIGRQQLMVTYGIAVPPALAAALSECYSQGGTGAVLAWSGRARAAFLVADEVRPTSAAAVAELRRLGLEPVLLTGDSAGAAMAVADQVGITAVIADALPEGKVEVVRRYQQAGHVVAMVGDGVNDAAALAQADLGLAMGSGTDIAIHASDLTLVRSDLTAVVDAIRLSRRTLGGDQGQPVLGLRLQLRRAAAGRRRPAEPDAGRRGDGAQLGLRRLQQPAPAPLHRLPDRTALVGR